MGYLVHSTSGVRGFVIPKAKFDKAAQAFQRLIKKRRHEVIDPDAVLEAPDIIAALGAAGFGTKLGDNGDLLDITYQTKLPPDASDECPEPLIEVLARFARADSELSFSINDDPEVVRNYRVFPRNKLDRRKYIPLVAYLDAPREVSAKYQPGLVVEIAVEIHAQPGPFQVSILDLDVDAKGVTNPTAKFATTRAPVPSTQILTVTFDPTISDVKTQYAFTVRGTQPIVPRADELQAPYSTRNITLSLRAG